MAIFTHKHDHRRGANAIENHHAYTGAYLDDETGLYYLSSRYYDPKTGSFTSADSYRGEGEQFWQLYAYCEGDPVNGTDLSGHNAKIILDSNTLAGLGHMSLLIERSNQKWYYYYYGLASVKGGKSGKNLRKILKEIPRSYVNNIKKVNAWAKAYTKYTGNYNKMLTLKGNFDKSFTHAMWIINNTKEKYHLTARNCATTSVEILYKTRIINGKRVSNKKRDSYIRCAIPKDIYNMIKATGF